MFNVSKNRGLLFLAVATAAMLFLGLWPFDYHIQNDARWVENGPGIRFSGQGIVTGGSGSGLLEKAHSDGITLEIALKPSIYVNTNVPRILSFADNQGKERFYLGQWKNSVILREIDRSGMLAKTMDRIGARDTLIPSKATVVTLTSDEKGTILYIDGEESRKNPHLNISSMMAESSIRHVFFGNAPTSVGGWKGEIYGFSLVDQILSPKEVKYRSEFWKNRKGRDLSHKDAVLFHLFQEKEGTTTLNKGRASGWDLSIPENLKPLKREFLPLPSVEALKMHFFYIDGAINFAGFIPFGFLMSLVPSSGLKERQNNLLLWGILASAALSLTIEFNQGFLLSCDSSMTDLILNTAGGGEGALIFLRLSDCFRIPVGSGNKV